jgi:hypothetical protein
MNVCLRAIEESSKKGHKRKKHFFKGRTSKSLLFNTHHIECLTHAIYKIKNTAKE